MVILHKGYEVGKQAFFEFDQSYLFQFTNSDLQNQVNELWHCFKHQIDYQQVKSHFLVHPSIFLIGQSHNNFLNVFYDLSHLLTILKLRPSQIAHPNLLLVENLLELIVGVG